MRKLIGLFRAVLVALLLVGAAPVYAAQYTDSAAVDELFAQLKVAPSAAEADDIAAQIWDYWFKPDVPDLADRMAKAGAAMRAGDLDSALSDLSGIVKDYPDYAEGWNQRATLYYILNNYEASLADIDKVLAIEPRHFGALSGRVMIYLKQGKHDLALQDMVAALAIHPYLSAKALFPELAPNVTHV
jgi:tetratricopeptide (TPR) repeat protein